MGDMSTLIEVKHIDYESRKSRCVGVISPAAQLFARRHGLQKHKRGLLEFKGQMIAWAMLFGGGVFHHFIKESTFDFTWPLLISIWGLLLLIARQIDYSKVSSQLQTIDDQLLILSSQWQGAGAAAHDFWQLRTLAKEDEELDVQSDEYMKWWRGWTRYLLVQCGLQESDSMRVLKKLSS